MTPRVSVIITTWNRAEMLARAIESVLGQTFKNFELLILDNNSSDETEKIGRRVSDTRVRYIQHPPLSISQARNLGVKESRGEFIGFLDDDDEWLPEKLEKQVALFERSEGRVGMIYGGFYRITREGKVYEEFQPRLRGRALQEYLCGRDPLTGSASNPLIRRKVFEVAGGYNERLRTSEDWEFYLRLMRKFEVDYVPEPVVNIRTHSGVRLGDRLREAADAEILVVKEFHDVLVKSPRCLSRYLQAIGGKFCRLGEMKTGRTYLREALAVFPLNLFAYAQYLFSFFGLSFYREMHAFYKGWR